MNCHGILQSELSFLCSVRSSWVQVECQRGEMGHEKSSTCVKKNQERVVENNTIAETSHILHIYI